MPHSYVSNLIHYIFSTKERYPFIDPELQSRLWPYMGGIARENRMKALALGGTNDHAHALLISTCNDERRESGSINQRRILKMGSRSIA
jgi:hypothetical protein